MRTTLAALRALHGKGEKIAALTCYDACFAALMESCGVDVLLVGDLEWYCKDTARPCPLLWMDGLPHGLRGSRIKAGLHYCRHAFGTSGQS